MADPSAIEQFTSITGADSATANFFLSAANNDMDAAVSTYFESGGVMPTGALPNRPAAPRTTAPRRTQPSNPAAVPSAPSRPANRRSGIATLGSLRGDGSDDDESGKNYYAGGEKSGQMIQDPRKNNGRPGSASDAPPEEEDAGPSNLADAIFERARARGPRTDEEREQFGDGQTFTGAGYRLGDVEPPEGQAVRPDIVGRRNVTRNLTFYANGFQVDDGPLRRLDDPENEAFLSDVNRGVVPREMEEPGLGDVSIILIDKKGEEYVPPKKKVVPFSGGGQRLSDGPSTQAQAAASSNIDTERAAAAVRVDESRPVATIQVRLSDGTRVVARLNEDSTVADLRAFVAASRPGVESFTLSTTYPRQVLDDDSATIKEAKLKGAVVLQTLK